MLPVFGLTVSVLDTALGIEHILNTAMLCDVVRVARERKQL